jgi:hypothetical protein
MRYVGLLLVAGAVSAGFGGSASASCVRMTAQEQRARATVIFDAVALDNPTGTGVQRFRVTRYLKGRGPRIVHVSTGFVKHADGSGTLTSVSLIVHRGERWRIFGRGAAKGIVRTTVCDGSRRR